MNTAGKVLVGLLILVALAVGWTVWLDGRNETLVSRPLAEERQFETALRELGVPDGDYIWLARSLCERLDRARTDAKIDQVMSAHINASSLDHLGQRDSEVVLAGAIVVFCPEHESRVRATAERLNQ